MINSNASIVPSPAGPSTHITPFLPNFHATLEASLAAGKRMINSDSSIVPSPAGPFLPNFHATLEASLAAGKRMTVKAIAVTYQMAPTKVRAELVAYYSRPGSPASITFRKGRTGGIMLFYKTTG